MLLRERPLNMASDLGCNELLNIDWGSICAGRVVCAMIQVREKHILRLDNDVLLCACLGTNPVAVDTN
jgi:hypothetical protein